MVGDSFTFGTAIDVEHTWPAVLGRELALGDPEQRFEVLNFAMEAINTPQEVALLRNRVLAFDPDLVLIAVHPNDASGHGIRPPERTGAWRADWLSRLGLTSGVRSDSEPLTPAQARTMSLRRRSRLADLVAHRLYYALQGPLAIDYLVADWDESSHGRLLFGQALAEASRLARQGGFELRVLHYPALVGLDGNYPFAAIRDQVELACREHDLAVPRSAAEPLRARGEVALGTSPRLSPRAGGERPRRSGGGGVAAHAAALRRACTLSGVRRPDPARGASGPPSSRPPRRPPR